MSNQINEGAARYKSDNNSSHSGEGGITEGNSNLPVPSDNQETRNCRSREGGNPLPIVDHLDLWTSTVTPKSTSGRGSNNKIELTGIKKLRELILELAVRGKLVAQNPDDEPASKLLEKIEAEKAQLIKDGKLKKQKPLAAVSEDEKPFDLPEGWEWQRLGALSHLITKGTTPTSVGYTFSNSGVNFLKIENLNRGRIDKASISQFISYETNKALSRSQLKAGDIVFSIAGTIGKTAIIYEEDLPANTNQALAIIRGTGSVFDQTFLRMQLDSFVAEKTRNRARGGAMPNVSLGDLSVLAAPIPPLAEQQRIVTKVDELMALCDQLEQQSEHQLTAHQQLTDTLLATLTDSADAQELNDNWQRLANHFDLLFSGPMGAWAIDRLKDTILQLAVMGKLVPQNPEDEPASKLLERIEEEKARLVKEGKIKKPKKLPPVSDEEKPFELPEGWEWENLGSLVVNMDSGWSPACPATPAPDERTWGVLKTTAVQRMKYLEEENKQLPSEKEPRPEYEVNAGDILITRAGPKNRVGISCLVKISRPKLMISDKIIRFHLASPASCGEFITLCLNAGATADYLERSKSGMAESQMNISQGKLLVAPIALPPLAEQQRIVAKVDELFALCDQLKDSLQQAGETEQHLTNAIVEQALN